MRVIYVFDIDIDVEDIDPEFVDKEGLAKNLARQELESIVNEGQLVDDDFEVVEEGKNNE